MPKSKLIRITTVPISLGGLLQGQLKFMSQYYNVLGISGKGGDMLERVSENEGIPVVPVEMTRKITPIKDVLAVYRLFKVFKREKPFIVHSHTPKAGTLGMMAAYLARVPHRLHTIAGLPLLEATGPKRTLLDIVEKLTYCCATKIYPNSFGLKDIVVQNGYTGPKKLKVIAKGSSNGIDTSFFDPGRYTGEMKSTLQQKLGFENDDTVFIFLGRLVADKGINELIEAFVKFNKEKSRTKLLLVGIYEKELDPLLPKTENSIDHHKDIVNVGWQNDVRPYFAISNILAFPSYREGFPNVVMQAGAMGLPSIVTDINGCNEIVVEGQNGLIIPAKNPSSIYGAMKKLMEDQELVDTMKRNARGMIISRYERNYVWQELLAEYRLLEQNE